MFWHIYYFDLHNQMPQQFIEWRSEDSCLYCLSVLSAVVMALQRLSGLWRMISSVVSSFDRSWQLTTRCIFLFLSSCLTQGESSFHEGMNVIFLFLFFPSSLSFVATTVISFKSWFLNKIEASWLWQRQWQSCQPAYDRFTFKDFCWGESGVRAGWRQQRLNTVKMRHLLSKFDFLLDLGHVPSVTSNVHSPLTSLVKDWPSSCQLKHCCECHTCSYQG